MDGGWRREDGGWQWQWPVDDSWSWNCGAGAGLVLELELVLAWPWLFFRLSWALVRHASQRYGSGLFTWCICKVPSVKFGGQSVPRERRRAQRPSQLNFSKIVPVCPPGKSHTPAHCSGDPTPSPSIVLLNFALSLRRGVDVKYSHCVTALGPPSPPLLALVTCHPWLGIASTSLIWLQRPMPCRSGSSA